jgi:hypothetical protein
LSRGKLAIAAG